MINDNIGSVWQDFFKQRSPSLWERYTGPYLGEVVETNDPLNMGRVRIRIPELHDRDLKPEECQWAKRVNLFGDKGAGTWHHPIIGDIILLAFEKNHPYVPIWIGSLPPTRRQSYPLPSTYAKSPLAVKDDGSPDERPDDTIDDYLPKDGRPMSFGSKDRYGNQIIVNSTGFFPKEHDIKAAPSGTDAISEKDFDIASNKPEVNDPDLKYINLMTKGGHSVLLSDVGYEWDKEFDGDFEKDQEFEEKRYKYLLRLANEDIPTGDDQRRLAMWTRYGHKLEMRDTGWNKTRVDEYDTESKEISTTDKDHRWIKIRTKAGHLIQAIDRGADPVDNENVKRLLSEEVGPFDSEDDWGDDARQVRIVTAHGHKFILDDVGSDPIDPVVNENPRGNGFLLRTRRGFAIDANDKDDANRLMIVSPDDQVIEVNDKYKYVLLTTKQSSQIHEDWQGLTKNEFHLKNGMVNDPEQDTFHLKLDNLNKRIRLKSPSSQGMELREGDKVWLEVRDSQDRGIFLNPDGDFGAWRGRGDRQIVIHDGERVVLVRNGDGKIQIASSGNIEILSRADITMIGENINLKARQKINMDGNGSKLTVGGGIGANATITAPVVRGRLPGAASGPGAPNSADSISNNIAEPRESVFTPLKPDNFDIDRGFVDNKSENVELKENFFSENTDDNNNGALIFS